MSETNAKLTLGPVLFNWPAKTWRDFYFRIADEADVDVVSVGEAVCSKRAPFYAPYVVDVIERLLGAGKSVTLSTLALIMNNREMVDLRAVTAGADEMEVEANDVAACALLAGKPHVIGPFINVYNEETLKYFAARGANRICLPVELGREAIRVMAATNITDIEVFAFGRLPLAISARCYHARHHGLHKDSCQFVCEKDPDGLELDTLDKEAFLAVNGVQTMSYTYQNLTRELHEMQAMGVSHFRLSPHACDMVAVAKVYREVLSGTLEPEAADQELEAYMGPVQFSNGYYHDTRGVDFTVG